MGAVATAVNLSEGLGRCESLAQLAVELGRLIERWAVGTTDTLKRRFVLVFDGIDKQREAPPTLIPALARMGELVSEQTLFAFLMC